MGRDVGTAMLQAFAAASLMASVSVGPARAGEVVYAARLAPDGTLAEERSVRCDVASGCVLAFDFAADDWRHGLSLQLAKVSGRLQIVARSEGVADDPLLVASTSIAADDRGGVMTTLSLAPPRPRDARGPTWLTGRAPENGFGPFLIAVHRLSD
jgi:hypothetical protein